MSPTPLWTLTLSIWRSNHYIGNFWCAQSSFTQYGSRIFILVPLQGRMGYKAPSPPCITDNT